MADEPERRVVGAILAELEKQADESPTGLLISPPDSAGQVWVSGLVDVHLLAQAVLSEVEPPKRPRLIEYDLPVRQTADLVEEPEPTTWYVPMRPRNLSSAVWEFVQVEAPTAEEALSKAISAKPGHAWRSPTKVEE